MQPRLMAESGKCEICESRPARLVMLHRHRGYERRAYVCRECAREHGKLHSGPLAAIFDSVRKQETSPAFAAPSRVCEFCGTRLLEQEDFKPGCAACYDRFEDVVEQRLRTVQGAVRHVGKTPPR